MSNFFEFNTLVSKFAILILALIIFLTVLKLGLAFITWIFTPPDHVRIIEGMVSAGNPHQFQEETDSDLYKIKRSVDQRYGLEFTWSTWINISSNELNNDVSDKKCIFNKGGSGDNNGTFDQNGPGLYLNPPANIDGYLGQKTKSLELCIIMDIIGGEPEEIIVPDIPIEKWINIMIRCKNKTIDIYVNGVVVKRHLCTGIPEQNYGQVNYGSTIAGWISNLWYWPEMLTSTEIRNIVSKGPNTTMITKGNNLDQDPRYFSLRWFFDNYSDVYGGL